MAWSRRPSYIRGRQPPRYQKPGPNTPSSALSRVTCKMESRRIDCTWWWSRQIRNRSTWPRRSLYFTRCCPLSGPYGTSVFYAWSLVRKVSVAKYWLPLLDQWTVSHRETCHPVDSTHETTFALVHTPTRDRSAWVTQSHRTIWWYSGGPGTFSVQRFPAEQPFFDTDLTTWTSHRPWWQQWHLTICESLT